MSGAGPWGSKRLKRGAEMGAAGLCLRCGGLCG